MGGSPLLRGGKKVGGGRKRGTNFSFFFRRWTKEEASFSPFPPQEDEESNSLRRARADGRTVIWLLSVHLSSWLSDRSLLLFLPAAFKVSFPGHPLPLGTQTPSQSSSRAIFQRTCDSKLKTIVLSIVI